MDARFSSSSSSCRRRRHRDVSRLDAVPRTKFTHFTLLFLCSIIRFLPLTFFPFSIDWLPIRPKVSRRNLYVDQPNQTHQHTSLLVGVLLSELFSTYLKISYSFQEGVATAFCSAVRPATVDFRPWIMRAVSEWLISVLIALTKNIFFWPTWRRI